MNDITCIVHVNYKPILCSTMSAYTFICFEKLNTVHCTCKYTCLNCATSFHIMHSYMYSTCTCNVR